MTSLIIFAVIAYGIYYFLSQRKGKAKIKISRRKQFEDLSEGLFLLSVLFFGVTLTLLNRNLGSPLSTYVLTLVSIGFGFAVAYWQRLRVVVFVSVIALLSWWASRTGTWADEAGVMQGATFLSFLLLVLSLYVWGKVQENSQRWQQFGSIFFLVAILLVTGMLFAFSSEVGLEALESFTEGKSVAESLPVLGMLLLSSMIFIGSLVVGVVKRALTPREIGIGVALVVVFGSILLLPNQDLVDRGDWRTQSELTSGGVMAAVFFNITLFAELLLLLFAGYQWRKEWLVNLGVVFLFLFILVKYFDWFFSFLDKSLFFIGAGILMFAIGWFMERSRRKLLENMRVEGSGGEKGALTHEAPEARGKV